MRPSLGRSVRDNPIGVPDNPRKRHFHRWTYAALSTFRHSSFFTLHPLRRRWVAHLPAIKGDFSFVRFHTSTNHSFMCLPLRLRGSGLRAALRNFHQARRSFARRENRSPHLHCASMPHATGECFRLRGKQFCLLFIYFSISPCRRTGGTTAAA